MKQIVINNISTSYFITKNGQCYNSNTNKYLKGQTNRKNKYISFMLTLPNGSKKRCYAHRLVAEAYIENPHRKIQVNHIDGNVLNNCVDNLEWVTPEENQQHALKNELRKFQHVYCFDKSKNLVAEYLNIKEAACAAGISATIIAQEVHKSIKTISGGFYWSYDKVLGPVKKYPNTGKSKIVLQYDLNGKFINRYESTGQAARTLGIKNSSHIGECCRGKIKTYKGFIWRYYEDIVSPSGEIQRECSEHL